MRRNETIDRQVLFIQRRAILMPLLFSLALVYPPTVGARQVDPRGSFTDIGFSIAGGPMQAFGDHSATQGDFSGHLNLIHISNFNYMGVGVEGSYRGDASMEIVSLMGRLEFGLKKGRPVGRRAVGFNTTYLALMAGYSKGTVWDQAFIDLYDATDEIEVTVSGVPLYAALGWRRIGRVGLNVEAIGGLTLITSQEAEASEGTAPSLVPGVGMRVGFGFDTFFYSRSR